MKGLLGGIGLALAAAGSAVAANDLDGRWVTESRNVEIAFAPCGPALCGSVVRVMANNAMSGSGKGANSPATVGMTIVSDLAPSGPGEWKGKIFNRENGKTYDCLLKPAGGTMSVRAYIGTPLIGKSQTWTRTAP